MIRSASSFFTAPFERIFSALMASRLLARRPVELPGFDATTLRVSDTLRPCDDHSPDVREMIARLTYAPETFDVEISRGQGHGDVLLSFDSPKPTGRPIVDRVRLDWHIARNVAPGQSAPAMLVLDILHGHNAVATFIARAFARGGVHGFVMHLPHNGLRRAHERGWYDWRWFVPSLKQGVADARRSRDVIAALPGVSRVGVQGTSLGGFVAAVAASIDRAFDPVILALIGGDVCGILTTGRMDAARVHQRLRRAGYDDERLRQELWDAEPLRLAHRLDPARTWLFSARWDQVVAPAFSARLADAARLPSRHRRTLGGCHYTCAAGAISIVSEMVRIART